MLHPVLRSNYAPLLPYLEEEGLRELCINRPGEVWLETETGEWKRFEDPKLDLRALLLLADSLANATGQSFHKTTRPWLACEMPVLKHRVQIVSGQMVDTGFAMAMRIKGGKTYPIESFGVKIGSRQRESATAFRRMLAEADQAGTDEAYFNLLKDLVAKRANILISGGTSTGKTTLLNNLLPSIPQHHRILTIEDVKELELTHPNSVRMIKSKTGSDIAGTTYKNIMDSVTRMRPDRILVGELDTENTFTFLRALNSGHEGSISTVHANPGMALQAIATNVEYNGKKGLTAMQEASRVVDIIVQLADTVNGKALVGIRTAEDEYKATVKNESENALDKIASLLAGEKRQPEGEAA